MSRSAAEQDKHVKNIQTYATSENKSLEELTIRQQREITALLEHHKEHTRNVVQETTAEMQQWAEKFRKQLTETSDAEVKEN